jgi:hypothetical protein
MRDPNHEGLAPAANPESLIPTPDLKQQALKGTGMQVVILAGGLGTRISEESSVRPKPMVEIGGRPILWHIMKSYLAHGLHDFVICCGYKGHVIKQFFRDYDLDGADVRFDMREGQTTVLRARSEPCYVIAIQPACARPRLRRVWRANAVWRASAARFNACCRLRRRWREWLLAPGSSAQCARG